MRRAPDTPQPIALRCHVEPEGWKPKARRRSRSRWPLGGFVVHTVAVPTAGEPLWFLVWALVVGGRIARIGLANRDGIPAKDIDALRSYAATQGWEPPLGLRVFKELLYLHGVQQRLPIVGWRLGEQMSRLAADWTRVTSGFYEGGWRLILWTWPPKKGRRWPRKRPILRNGEVEMGHRYAILVKPIDGTRNIMSFGPAHKTDRKAKTPEGSGGTVRKRSFYPGRFVDVATFALGLSGKMPRRLADACRAFEVGFEPRHVRPSKGLTPKRIESAVAEARGIAALYLAELREHERFGMDITPDQVYGPGSHAESYLETILGRTPPLARFGDYPRHLLGRAMGAFHGGECFCWIRGVAELRVKSLDFRGLFPMMAARGGAMDLLAARRIEVIEEDPAEVEALIGAVATKLSRWVRSEGGYDPLSYEEWRRLFRTIVEVEARGDVMPHKVRPRAAWLLTVSALISDVPVPLSAFDAVRACIETSTVPKVRKAFRQDPVGRRRLHPIILPSGRRIDPNTQDFFLELAAERIRLETRFDLSDAVRDRLRGFLKLVDNAACSGLFVQVISDEPHRTKRPVPIWTPWGEARTARVHVIETPGRWYFPAIACAVEGAARLVLTLGRTAIEVRGGTVAYADTDSLFPVESLHGELIACLGGSERTADGREGVPGLDAATIREVRLLMEELSAYPDDLRPTDHRWVSYPSNRRLARPRGLPVAEPGALFLKLEAENFAGGPSWPTQAYLWALAPKRYDVYQLRKPGLSSGVGWVAEPSVHDIRTLTAVDVVKASEHALTYREPTGHDDKRWISEGFEYLNRVACGLIAKEPEWFDEPALFVVSLTHPVDLDNIAGIRNRRNPLRPWSRVAIGVPVHRTHGGPRVVPVAPWYEGADPHALDWRDAATGRPIDVRTETPMVTTTDLLDVWVTIRSMRGVFAAHARGYDATALGPDGEPCGARTVGLLWPSPTTGHGFYLIGKETRRMQVVGILQDPEYVSYAEPDPWPDVRAALGRLAEVPSAFRRIAAIGGIHPRTVERGRQDRVNAKTKRILVGAVASYVRLDGDGSNAPNGASMTVARYLRDAHVLPRRCEACGAPLTGTRRRFCGPACRQRAYRERKTA